MPLDRDAVTAAGVRVVAGSGWSALSLRAVAGELEVTPMALYRHVADADALRAAVLEAIVARCARVRDTGDLGADLEDWARRLRDDLAAHPAVAGWLLTHWFASGEMLDRVDELLALAARHGIEGFEAVAVTNAVMTYVLMRSEAEREIRSAGVVRRQLRTSAAVRPLTYLTALASHYATAEFDAHFDFGLRALVDGMRLPRGRAA